MYAGALEVEIQEITLILASSIFETTKFMHRSSCKDDTFAASSKHKQFLYPCEMWSGNIRLKNVTRYKSCLSLSNFLRKDWMSLLMFISQVEVKPYNRIDCMSRLQKGSLQ